MTHIALLAAAFILCQIAYVLGTVIVGRILGFSSEEVGIGVGPALIKLQHRDVDYRLNCIVISSYVRLQRPDFEQAGFTRKMPVIAAGCFSLLLLSVACFHSEGLQIVFRGFPQIIIGAQNPAEDGKTLATTAFDFLGGHGFFAVVGATAGKMCAFNLLPIPNLPGGQLLLTLWGSLFPLPERTHIIIVLMGMLLTLAVSISWLVAAILAMTAS